MRRGKRIVEEDGIGIKPDEIADALDWWLPQRKGTGPYNFKFVPGDLRNYRSRPQKAASPFADVFKDDPAEMDFIEFHRLLETPSGRQQLQAQRDRLYVGQVAVLDERLADERAKAFRATLISPSVDSPIGESAAMTVNDVWRHVLYQFELEYGGQFFSLGLQGSIPVDFGPSLMTVLVGSKNAQEQASKRHYRAIKRLVRDIGNTGTEIDLRFVTQQGYALELYPIPDDFEAEVSPDERALHWYQVLQQRPAPPPENFWPLWEGEAETEYMVFRESQWRQMQDAGIDYIPSERPVFNGVQAVQAVPA